MTMNRIWLRRGIWLLAGVIAAGLLFWAFAPRPVEVETAPVTRGPFHKTVDEDGKSRVRDRYVVSAPIPGRLLRVDLKAGAAVEPGTLLARLAPAAPAPLDARTELEYRERLGAAEATRLRAGASVERAGVALAQAKAEETRATKLAAEGFASRQALDNAQREVELKAKELAVAQFDGHAAEHQVALAQAALSRYRQDAGGKAQSAVWEIRSPVAGRVLRVVQESEAIVASGAAILEIGDPRSLEVVVDVLTADAAAIGPGADVALDHGVGEPVLAGRVRLVEPSAFTKVSALGVEEQRVNVVIDFAAPTTAWGNLGDGHRVDARITVDTRDDAVLVPLSALFRHGEGWAVFAVDGGRARLRPVNTGPRNGKFAVVLGGLELGTQVIAYPSDSVSDGTRVRMRGSVPNPK
jgi:HlyD family secretion protein